jgi:hypothetical protein
MRRLLFVVAALAGCRERSAPPEPPDMADLVTAYEAQDGRLTGDTAPALVAGVAASLREAEALRDLAVEVIAALSAADGEQAREDGLAVRRRALSAEGDAWARVTHRCGDLDGDDGEIVLRYVFADDGPGEVVWGEADDCLLGAAEAAHRLDGDVRVHLPDLRVPRLVVAFDGEWARGAAEAAPLAVDVQLDFEAQRLFVRRRLEDGARFLVGLSLAEGDGSPLLVRDRDGLWTCRVETGFGGGRCERDGAEVRW